MEGAGSRSWGPGLDDVTGVIKTKWEKSSGEHIGRTIATFVNLDKLKVLSLRSNKFFSVPIEIYNFNNIEVLDLSHNKIDKLPNELQNFYNLIILRLTHNNLTDISIISNLITLEVLNLNNNEIETIPKKFENLKNLRCLGLSFNNIKEYNINITSLENLILEGMDLKPENIDINTDQCELVLD